MSDRLEGQGSERGVGRRVGGGPGTAGDEGGLAWGGHGEK